MAIWVYCNGRHARESLIGEEHVLGVNTPGLKILQGVLPEDILTELGYHGHIPAQFGGHHRLISALAAIAHMKTGAVQSLAHAGQARHVANKIKIGCAYDADPRFCHEKTAPQ